MKVHVAERLPAQRLYVFWVSIAFNSQRVTVRIGECVTLHTSDQTPFLQVDVCVKNMSFKFLQLVVVTGVMASSATYTMQIMSSNLKPTILFSCVPPVQSMLCYDWACGHSVFSASHSLFS